MRRYVQFKVGAAALAIAALAIMVVVGVAAAGPAGSVKTFTGCLATGDGVIIKVKEGDQPKSACTSGQTLARLSGGDITKISVTGGLTLTNGGESGDVEINLDPKYTLPQSCSDGQVAKWRSSTNTWICAADNDTTYAEGTGIDLSGSSTTPANQFSIESAYRLPGKACANAGEFSRGFDSSGVIQCATPTATGPSAWIKRVAYADTPQIATGNPAPTIAALSLPAGVFLVTVTAEAADDLGGNSEVDIDCWPSFAVTSRQEVASSSDHDHGTLAMSDVTTLSAPGSVSLICESHAGSDHLEDVRLIAVQLASVAAQ